MIPWSFKKAITEPENVIAPTAAPIDISTKLPNLIFPAVPRLNASGLTKADMATKTAASPTKLWNPATNSGIAVIGILYAINAPIEPPIKINNKTKTNPIEKLPIAKKVTVTAIIIPNIPNRFPLLAVSGEESPFKAIIKNTEDILENIPASAATIDIKSEDIDL